MSDFFAKLGMLSDKKLDWKCSNCKRKFRAKCNAASHIAQSSCKRMSATVLFIGVANELLRAQPIIEADESIKNIIPNVKKAKSKENVFAIPLMELYASDESDSDGNKENNNPELQLIDEDVREHLM